MLTAGQFSFTDVVIMHITCSINNWTYELMKHHAARAARRAESRV
jgi:hypothetical protein